MKIVINDNQYRLILENQQDELSKNEEILNNLTKYSEENKVFEIKKSPIPYEKGVEDLQTSLQFLGFSLPKWGVDGKFGPETKKAVIDFQKNSNLSPNGKVDKYFFTKLVSQLIKNGFEDFDLSRVQKKSEIKNLNIGSDKEFYEEILKGIEAPVTDENLKFLYAWRQAEGGKAKNNPFNTTMNNKDDVNISNYNKIGVKNYSTKEFGVESTVKTLMNGKYSCLVNGLRNDIGSDRLASCLKTTPWGTGDLVISVLSGTINPPKIYA